MVQKRFDEYFAKVVLEYCFPEKFTDLQIADKPDLRCGNEIGIEVTNCMPKRVSEAFKLWRRAEKQGEQTPPRILERLEQLDEVQLDEKGLLWDQGHYSDNFDNSPLKDFFKAVEKKVERLNSSNADYAKMDSYELFVHSFLLIPRYQFCAVVERLKQINSEQKKFDTIYLITNEQKLYGFDMANNTFKIKYLYNRLERLADKAQVLCKGANNE